MRIISTNITSPLGLTTEENYRAVREGMSSLRQYAAGTRGVPFAFCASLFDDNPLFEELAVQSACEALSRVSIDASRTVFILSSTKGELLTPLGDTATRIARRIGIANKPVVVCNACISGVAAQVLAMRLIDAGEYDYAVVTGADVLTDFIISGFQSLKSLSPEPCRPFDIERLGLNLGEAAATMVFAHDDDTAGWHVEAGAVANDSYHITNPHPKGEGCYRAIKQVEEGRDGSELAAVSVHGTATMYNDQMEAMAIGRSGLADVPLTALKSYCGHTLGAAGLLETILTARALDDGLILPVKGFETLGVSVRMNISSEARHTQKRDFIKVMSGFGGCNAAIRVMWKTGRDRHVEESCRYTSHTFRPTFKSSSNQRWRRMDILSRTAFSAVEQALQSSEGLSLGKDDTAVILFNRTSSVVSDRKYIETISRAEEYFPSPSVFIYTLPNIATGEIALHFGLYGETSFYILPDRDEKMMQTIVDATLRNGNVRTVISGWVDCPTDDSSECEITITRKE